MRSLVRITKSGHSSRHGECPYGRTHDNSSIGVMYQAARDHAGRYVTTTGACVQLGLRVHIRSHSLHED